METTITRAAAEDLNDVAPLFADYRKFYGQPVDLERASAFLERRLAQGDSAILLARRGDQPVGFAQLYPTFSSVALKRVWILNDLYVAEFARRSHVATNLIDQAVSFARQDGAARLILATAIDNSPARALYEKLGWKRDEAFLHYLFSL